MTGITKAYEGVVALDGVDLEVRGGEIHGLVGENGAGKSTLVSIAAGVVPHDDGEVEINGQVLSPFTPATARDAGIAIAHQEPALVKALSVAENLWLTMPPSERPRRSKLYDWANEVLDQSELSRAIEAHQIVDDLTPSLRFAVEISRAMHRKPRLLILDEPTEHLGAHEADQMFAEVRSLAEGGCAIIYISHRIREVRSISDRITVLRNGRTEGTFQASEIEEDAIVNLIAGRNVGSTFPEKSSTLVQDDQALLTVDDLSSTAFQDVNFSVFPGEIVGLAGIEGGGQRELIRALAGLDDVSDGQVSIKGEPQKLGSPWGLARSGVSYAARDRGAEGLLSTLSVRDNLAIRTLDKSARWGFIRSQHESRRVQELAETFAVKTPDLETRVENLSGGNQQKVVLTRALSTNPTILLGDEPTQGVDVGAREEIYRIIRKAASEGSGAVITSTDSSELAGLCDRVLVFARGKVIATLAGDEVTEQAIMQRALTVENLRTAGEGSSASHGWRRLMRGEYSTAVMLAVGVVLLGAYVASVNPAYLTARNIEGSLAALAILGFISLAQHLPLLTGAVDLSVGPLSAFVAVIGSFTLTGTVGPSTLVGFLAIGAAGAALGVLHWLLIDRASIHPLVVTLVTYMALQGLSLTLRPTPGGVIDFSILEALSTTIGPVPVAAIAVVLAAILLEIVLRRTVLGASVRAIGYDVEAASKVGLNLRKLRLVVFAGCSLLTCLGGILLMAQIGVGDATAGNSYTLDSIAAVAIGGASLTGGRGSFIGTLMGCVLLQQLISALGFLNLSSAWQQFLPGLCTLLAVGAYSYLQASPRKETT